MRVWAAVGRLAFAALAVWAFWILSDLDVDAFGYATGQGLLKLALWGLPCLVLGRYLTRHDRARDPWSALGLTSDLWRGYLLGAIATAPMLAAWLLSPARSRLDVVVGDALLGPLAEELLFRGFLFVGLRRIGVSLWSAMVLSALMFGGAHLLNFRQMLELLWASLFAGEWRMYFLEAAWWTSAGATALSAAAAGVLFAWLTERSGSLWSAVGVHTAINFWWVMSHRSGALRPETATAWAVASALSTVAAIVIVEWLRNRQRPAPIPELEALSSKL